VNNTNTACFPVSVTSGGDGKFAHFIFANLNGTNSAWDMGATAFIQVTTPPGRSTPDWRSMARKHAFTLPMTRRLAASTSLKCSCPLCATFASLRYQSGD
jgi:hypothetical protein